LQDGDKPIVRRMNSRTNALRTALLTGAFFFPAVSFSGADGQIVIDWNARAYESAFADDQFQSFKGQRAHAMMHLAQHDALNGIERRYYRYLADKRRPHKLAPHADARAAASQAAHDVLLSEYPKDAAALAALLTQHLAKVPEGTGKDAGREVGRRAAASIVAVRAKDDILTEGSYTFATGAGTYQTTPDWKGFVGAPALGDARPFFLHSGAQFRPAPPPALSSSAYATALDEVRRFGAADSKVRTADQTAYAVWWMEFAEGSVNRLARKLAADSHLDLWETARLFALLDAGLMDAYIAVWSSKFHFNHWRPYTAIRASADPGWNSLRPVPPTPDYVSAHAAGCAVAFRVLEEFFPRTKAFAMDSKTAPPGMPRRSFASFRAAAHECADSRVRLGFHFRYATDAGERMGRDIAEHVVATRLRNLD
jgi:hypothetical protein